jgi:autotransporter-associated beta strand protein
VAANEVSWETGYTSVGGGFAARGGNLNIAINGTGAITTPLVWDYTNYFVQNGSVLSFGATNANSIVNFENAINLGYANSYGTSQGAELDLYLRNIVLTGATGDNLLNPFAVSDPAVLSGIISAGAPYLGLALSGNGVLVLSNAGNTYTGATSIGGTSSLLINNDQDLGLPSTAAYALNVDPTSGIAGGAITPGAVVINGGATLGIYYAPSTIAGTYATTTGTVALSPYRTILLASGAVGATPSNIDVQTGTTAIFGGLIGNYVGEIGSLNKTGLGTLDLSGVNSTTGSLAVS